MERPSSAQRARISAGESADTTRSGSKISTPSNPAAAAAASLSSSVPEMQTVASAVRSPLASDGCSAVALRTDPDMGPAPSARPRA